MLLFNTESYIGFADSSALSGIVNHIFTLARQDQKFVDWVCQLQPPKEAIAMPYIVATSSLRTIPNEISEEYPYFWLEVECQNLHFIVTGFPHQDSYKLSYSQKSGYLMDVLL